MRCRETGCPPRRRADRPGSGGGEEGSVQAERVGGPRAGNGARVAAAMDKVGIAHRARHYPHQLSGGQQQRAAIARAIVGDPKLILADEPTGNLDTQMARGVMQLLEELHAEGATILMVTHDPELAARAQRNVHVIDGQVVDLAPEPRMRGLGVVMPQAVNG